MRGRLRISAISGARAATERRPDQLRLPLVAEALGALRYDEVAVAVSEPLAEALPRLRRDRARRRGRP